ncbi:VWA domain-containing protein [Coleofasciculus sp. FACHB-SPT9]|uniref:vWA domain-containing protein n=1 Tax=Cyanophyceae TaxID=3028117 RepID=UPI001689B52F|nr:VWA domain-containing protein [Coleofasciculus sp. FACHB-SPT9]MBD1892507.1 VWA domain-containing protein [Coleofasciculus sp. FACHB-SPT9]
MKATYSLSQSLIAAATPSTVDLIVSFKAEEETCNKVPRLPLNLSVVIDRSGSMAGAPLKNAIQAAQRLVEYLTPEDFLSVVIYDDTPETILQHQLVQDKAVIRSLIGKVKAGGCTNLSGGWLMGCDNVKSQQSTERINRVLLLTDGQANVGITDSQVLINTARQQAEQGIITTTLGFGTYFNEDLLIGMANAAGGNFYFIQSPDDATDVFRIELESLTSVVAQNLTVTLQPEDSVQITGILNNYRSNPIGNNLEVFCGDVYEVENKQLAVELSIHPQANLGVKNIATVAYKYQAVVDGSIQQFTDEIPISLTVADAESANNVQPNAAVVEQTSKLRIGKVKDEAIALADKGDYTAASQKLRKTIEDLKLKALHESFEVAEEMEQLDYYAQRLESKKFDSVSRKEMRDQSYQALTRDRGDLKLRGLAASANSLQAVSSVDAGVLVKCDRISGKLRIHVISDGYNPDFNVQFPRNIREEGVTYIVDEINLSANGSFYRVSGNIRRLVQPGQERAASSQNGTSSSSPKRQKLNAPASAADLETIDTVGDGVLVQCVKEGSKLRARVVSDGYDPNYNIRFPRDIREENVLYVVDEVEEAKNGGSYVAYGKICRLVQ